MKVLDHEVFCIEYDGPNAEREAGLVWESARDQKLEHCSVWRTTTTARDRWCIVVADQSGGQARHLIDFRGGVEREMDEREVYAFLERRLGRAIDARLEGKTEVRDVIRYGRRGARLRRGGNLDPDVGQG